MSRIEYGVLLLAVAALSFTLGTNFATAVPPAACDPPATGDSPRLLALERRVDALMSERMTAAPAVVQSPARQIADATGPALAELVASLRDALLGMSRPAPVAAATPAPSAANRASIQQILADAIGDGPIENSDLVMLTLPQLLARLGRPSRAETNSHGEIVMEFPCGRDGLHVGLKDGLVVEVHAYHERG